MLKIDDKDYSITFSLYFNVQWSEPRLNLSREFLDTENITAEEDQLVPGTQNVLKNVQFYKTDLGLSNYILMKGIFRSSVN